MTEVSSAGAIMLTLMPAIIGLAGVLVGSTIAVAKDVVISRTERQRNGIYAAIRIVGVLDQYAQKCIDVVYDDGTSLGQPAGRTSGGEAYHVVQVEAPDPPTYPNDIDWKSLLKPLAYRALTLPNAARDTDRHIGFAAEHAFPPDYEEVFDARQVGYARLGLEAIQLASALRAEFDLTPKDRSVWNAEWDPEAFLLERLEKAKGGAA